MDIIYSILLLSWNSQENHGNDIAVAFYVMPYVESLQIKTKTKKISLLQQATIRQGSRFKKWKRTSTLVLFWT